MQIGDVVFDVSPGMQCGMRQEWAAVDPVSRDCTMMGDIKQRVVVTPNVDVLLSGRVPQWKYAEGAVVLGSGGGRRGNKRKEEEEDGDVVMGDMGIKGVGPGNTRTKENKKKAMTTQGEDGGKGTKKKNAKATTTKSKRKSMVIDDDDDEHDEDEDGAGAQPSDRDD